MPAGLTSSRKVLAVCGPTAAGKSALADQAADRLVRLWDAKTPVIVVDSMQVYEGLAEITNQARRRPAELVGVAPVTERWTVARHREAAGAVISAHDTGAVLDAGTGMYLNAILLDLPLAPEVPEEVRRRAARESAGRTNPRRAARELELRMVGAQDRGSVWDGAPRYDTTLVYLRPDRALLDASIAHRTTGIVDRGVREAETLAAMRDLGEPVNPSVLDAVGVKEMLLHVKGELSRDEARQRIETRTRRLARRQMRWFDKLVRTLHGRTETLVTDDPSERRIWNTMHDRMVS